MAELTKLNNIGRAKTQHQLDMEAMQRGAGQAGSLLAPAAPVAPSPVADVIPAQAGETPEEAAIAGQQAANLKNPGIQDKLNAVAKARAKFYGEGM